MKHDLDFKCKLKVPFLKLSNFRIPRHLKSNHLRDPAFYHFFKNHIFWPKKAQKRQKTRFLKIFKRLALLNDYLGDTRPSNYWILGEGALNFHLKSDSSFYHFYSWFYALFLCPCCRKLFRINKILELLKRAHFTVNVCTIFSLLYTLL